MFGQNLARLTVPLPSISRISTKRAARNARSRSTFCAAATPKTATGRASPVQSSETSGPVQFHQYTVSYSLHGFAARIPSPIAHPVGRAILAEKGDDMARDHLEFIQTQVLPWITLPETAARPGVACKVLSRDPDSGAVSVILKYPAGFEIRQPTTSTTMKSSSSSRARSISATRSTARELRLSCRTAIPRRHARAGRRRRPDIF